MQSNFLDLLLSRLEAVKQVAPDRWMARCPAHHDEHPSLSIKLADDRILLHCFAGCKYQDILKALRIEAQPSGDEPEDIYVYRSADGTPLFRKLRYPGKRFLIEHVRAGHWAKGQGSAPNVLYNLPEVKKAEKVYIVEGEKDAENLARFGLVATTNPHGANEPDLRPYAEHFRGKDVVIIPDQDEPGLKLAQRWMELLFPIAKSVKIVNLPPPAKDVSDFLAVHPISDLFELEEDAQSFSAFAIKEDVSEAIVSLQLADIKLVLTRGKQDTRGYDFWRYHAQTRQGATSGLIAINNFQMRRREASALEEKLPTGLWNFLFEKAASHVAKPSTQIVRLAEIKAEAPSFVIRPFLIRDGANIIFGPGGTLKSHWALVLCKCLTNNWLPPGNHDIELLETGVVLYLDWEDEIGPFLDRAKKLGIDLEKIFYMKCTKPFIDILPEIQQVVKEINPVAVFFDSLGPAISGGNAFSLETASAFFSAAKTLGKSFCIIAHPPKHMHDTVYGSVFFENLARNIFQVDAFLPEPSFVIMQLSNKKASYYDGSLISYKILFAFLGTETDVRVERIVVSPKNLGPSIVFLLEKHNRMSLKDLRLNLPAANESAIRKELLKLKELGRVDVDEDGHWYLLPYDFAEEVPF